MSDHKWQTGPIKLAKGCDAVIYRFCEIRKRYIGEWKGISGRFYAAEWNMNGEHTVSGIGEPLLNLAPPPKKTVRLEGWLNIYDDNSANFFDRREDADKEDGRSACVPIDITATEGDGL
jgi:hypothetical protein